MFQTAAGVSIPFPEQIQEQYQQDGDTLLCNLSFEKLPDFIHSFYQMIDEPLFLAIHPDAESDEVWYLDGMTRDQLETILNGYGELLYQDGLSAFAIGSLTTEEELFVQKYKILSLYSRESDRFVPLLKQFGLRRTPHLITAWDTFTAENPGSAERLEIAGQTVPDLIQLLQKIGMYRASAET